MRNRTDVKKCDVFISWTGTDTELKRAISVHLKQNGIIPLLSDEECQGDFEEWSRSAATSAHIFMPIITRNALKSAGMEWELEEIDERLRSDEKDFWRKAILPICEDLEVFSEYVNKFSDESKAIMRKISAIPLRMDGELPSPECLDEISRKAADRICDNFFELYTSNACRSYIKLVPLYTGSNAFGDTNYNFDDLYIKRSITETDEDKNDIDTFFSPDELFKAGQVSFIYGPAGCGKTQYINQIRRSADDCTLVITLSCADVATSSGDLFDDMFEEFHKICGKRKFYTKENFSRLLDVKDLVIVLDGLDEITTRSATRSFIEKIDGFFSYNADYTALIFTGRNERDKDVIVLGDVKTRTFRLNKLSDQNVECLGNNLFLLFGNENMGQEFYVKIRDLNNEIKTNPLLLSQLAIVYNDSKKIPETVVGILDAVSEITFRTDREMHRNLTAIPNEYQSMVSNDISGILKSFSRERYITSSIGKDISAGGIFNRILKNKYAEDKSVCKQRTEFLLEYLSNRAIFVGENFYHKMFLEYFTAVSYYEDSFDEDYGELEDTAPIADLFSHYGNPYWNDVIKLFLVKADSNIGSKETEKLYEEILLNAPIEDYSLLFDVCRELICNKEAAELTLLTSILSRSAGGELPPYGPLFWYVPEYELYEVAMLAADRLKGNAKALALVRDVCFIFGRYTAESVTKRVNAKALFEASKGSLSGIRLALCQLFYTGESDYVGDGRVYPRCFSVSEARSFMELGHGEFIKTDAKFEDELGIFEDEMYPVVGGEYIGFIFCPYDKFAVADKLNEKPCHKISILALSTTSYTDLDYIAFTRSSIRIFYIPENIETFAGGCIAHMPLDLLFLPINELLLYVPLSAKTVTVPKDFTYLNGIFAVHPSIEEVILPEGLTEIRENTFDSCGALSRIKLPSTLKRIGEYAFSGCDNLESIDFPIGIEAIEANAFSVCNKLKEIILPEGLTELGKSAFYSCDSLSRVDFPESLTYVGDHMFWGCNKLEVVNFSDNITEIGIFAFLDCKCIKELKLPKKLKTIGHGAFSDCEAVESVIFPEGLLKIDSFAFSNCKKITELNLPSTLSESGSSPFLDCESIEKIEIADGSIYFPFEIIRSCRKLKRLVLPQTLLRKANSVQESVSIICRDTGMLYIPNEFRNRIIILKEGTTKIAPHEFEGSSVEHVTFPTSLKEIGDYAFYSCRDLYEIILPKNLERIGDHAFDGCYSATRVGIPNGVKYIGDGAFESCYDLKCIYVPDSVEYLGKRAFNGCFSVNTLHLPSGLTEIPDNMFDGCSSLESINFPDTLKRIGMWAFTCCYKLTSLLLPDGITEISGHAFDNCNALARISLPTSLTKLGTDAFSRCASLIYIIIPENVKEIESCTFEDCTKLVDVILPDGITRLGWRAFKGCTAITSMELPKELGFIDQEAFLNCTNLSDISFPQKLEVIGPHAFKNCTSLSSINIHESINMIGEGAFENCVGLTELNLPVTLEKIDNNAFAGCTELRSVTISKNFKKDVSAIFGDIDPKIITWI